MKFFIVDAFTQTLFGGNPAGVVWLGSNPFPSDETMQKTARELRYSETAFVHQLDGSSFHTRYFTPEAEVDLCGHATIALFHALAQAQIIDGKREYSNRTLAGNLRIVFKEEMIFMEMGTPEALGVIDDPTALLELYTVMGAAEAVPKKENTLLPEIISTGLPDIMLPVENEELLNAIRPDSPALTALSEAYDVVGVHAFTLHAKDAHIHVRNFAPRYAIDEEAATGTANGALTYYLYRHGIRKEGDTTFFIQGEAMDRPSQVVSFLRLDHEGVRIDVGGRAVTLAEGEIFLP